MTPERLQELCRDQISWCEVFNQLVLGAAIQEALSDSKVAVYVTSGTPMGPNQPAPHRYLYFVSDEKVDDVGAFSEAVKAAAEWWNAMNEEQRLAEATTRLKDKWTREKLVRRLKDKGFSLRG